jgi:DNA polymerase-3 subunit delta'
MGSESILFASIEGHARPISILKRALANNSLAHAYLFSGEQGIGKRMTACALAAAVNCPNARSEDGCGTCPSCRKISTQGHPDVHFLEPDGDEIKIEQIRQVQDYLALKPFEGTKKILIVDGAESLNQASSNAFLKTLEEPPGDTLIILLTSLPQSLLATIRSRCQEIRFHPLPRRILAQALVQKRGLSEEDAWFLAALAQGSLGRGLQMDIALEKSDRKDIISLLSGLKSLGPGELLTHADSYAKDRDRFERLLAIGVEWLRDMMVARLNGDAALLINAYANTPPGQEENRFSLQKILADMELFFLSRSLLERRVSTQLVAENLFFGLGKG